MSLNVLTQKCEIRDCMIKMKIATFRIKVLPIPESEEMAEGCGIDPAPLDPILPIPITVLSSAKGQTASNGPDRGDRNQVYAELP